MLFTVSITNFMVPR